MGTGDWGPLIENSVLLLFFNLPWGTRLAGLHWSEPLPRVTLTLPRFWSAREPGWMMRFLMMDALLSWWLLREGSHFFKKRVKFLDPPFCAKRPYFFWTPSEWWKNAEKKISFEKFKFTHFFFLNDPFLEWLSSNSGVSDQVWSWCESQEQGWRNCS